MGWLFSPTPKPEPTVEKTPEELEEEQIQLEIQKIKDALERLEDEDVTMLKNNIFFKDTLKNEKRDFHLVKELTGYMNSLIEDKGCEKYKNITKILTMFQPFLLSKSAKEKIFDIMTQEEITNKCGKGITIQQLIANVFTNYNDKKELIELLQKDLKRSTDTLNNLSVVNPRSKEKNDAEIKQLKASLKPLLIVLGWSEQQGWEPPAPVPKIKGKAPPPLVSKKPKTVGGTRKKCKPMRKNRTRK